MKAELLILIMNFKSYSHKPTKIMLQKKKESYSCMIMKHHFSIIVNKYFEKTNVLGIY